MYLVLNIKTSNVKAHVANEDGYIIRTSLYTHLGWYRLYVYSITCTAVWFVM